MQLYKVDISIILTHLPLLNRVVIWLIAVALRPLVSSSVNGDVPTSFRGGFTT